MRVAIVDCGTNTVRLLIADEWKRGLVEVVRTLRFARLGEGVDATGRFQPEALERTFAAVEEYAGIIADHKVDKVRFVATSAARDASNKEELFAGVRSLLGVTPEIISGEEEAELSFLGAISGSRQGLGVGQGDGSMSHLVNDSFVDNETILAVIDIGGGSTEIIRGFADGRVIDAVSLDVGSVRVKERFWAHDPPLTGEIAHAREFISTLLDSPGQGDGSSVLPSPRAGDESGQGDGSSVLWMLALDPSTWIGVAGTHTSLSAMNQDLPVYDRAMVHDSVLTPGDVEALCEDLLTRTVEETIAAYPSLDPQRAPVIASGALICAEITRRTGQPLIVRETDILDGGALRLMRS